MLNNILSRKELLALLFISLLAIFAFGKTYQNEFLGMDDHVYVWDNPYIKDGLTFEGLKWAFQADLTQPTEFADYWQPITFISRMIDISLFKMNAGAHHLVNLLFHLFNVILLYLFLLRITGKNMLSLWITSLFAIHPLHAEVIGWITARKDVLSVFFGLITMHIYLWTHDNKIKTPILPSFILAMSFAISLMAKPMMITLPVLLLIVDYFMLVEQKKSVNLRVFWQKLFNKWSLFLIVACYLPIPFMGQPQAFEFDVNHPLARAVVAIIFYIKKILVPTQLSLYGPIPEPTLSISKVVLCAVVIFLISIGAFLLRKRAILLLTGWLWFLVSSLPIIGLTWVADRFVYFPLIGVLMMFCGVLELICPKKRFISGVIIVWCAFFMYQSFHQISVWRNDETIMLRALEYSTENYAAHNVLGVVYAKIKDNEKAMHHLDEAIRIYPERDKPYNNIGRILEGQKRYEEAAYYYEKSIELNPTDFRTVNNLAIVYVRTEKYAQAIKYFNHALTLNPKADDIRNNIAITYFKAGDFRRAEELAKKYKSPVLFNQFGLFMAVDKKYTEARQYFNQALFFNPRFKQAQDNLRRLDSIRHK